MCHLTTNVTDPGSAVNDLSLRRCPLADAPAIPAERREGERVEVPAETHTCTYE
jgi:hypothetical protein